MATFYQWENKNLILSIYVQPRASHAGIVGIYDNQLKIKTTAAPIDGKANKEVCQLLAKLFGVAKSKVNLLSGQTNRHKRFCIQSPKKLPDLIAPQKLE